DAFAGGEFSDGGGDSRAVARGGNHERGHPADCAVAGGCVCGVDEQIERMNIFRGLNAILLKEFITVLRDPVTLFFMLFPPLVEMIAFGYALDNDIKHMATIVLNEDRTVESRTFINAFENTQTFRVIGEVQSVSELAAEIRRG